MPLIIPIISLYSSILLFSHNKIKTIKLYPPYQGKKVLEYDKYEIKINEAYTE